MFPRQILLNVSKNAQKNHGSWHTSSKNGTPHHLQKWHAHIKARNRKPQKLTITKQPCTRANNAMGKETGAHVVPDLFVSWIQSLVGQSSG